MAKVKGVWGEIIEVPDAPASDETQQQNGGDQGGALPSDQSQQQNNDEGGGGEQQQQQQPDIKEILSRLSDGIITDEDGFKVVLPKIKGYDELDGKYKELETKIPKFSSETAREMYEYIASGKDDVVKSYLDEKYRDYDTMSDIDAVRWQLKKDNPDWKDKDVEIEIKGLYGKSLEPVTTEGLFGEELEKAVAKNEAIEERIDKLVRDARDARIKLNKQKQNIQLPKLTKEAPAGEPKKEPTAEEIADQQKQWETYTEQRMKDLSDFKWTVEGEEVNYKLTDDDKKSATSEMKAYNAAKDLTDLGWRDKDGNLFPDKIAKDRYLIKNIDKIIKAAFTQGKTNGKEAAIAEIKNLNLKPGGANNDTPQGVDVWQRMSQRINGN